jgi:hypothetical protein
MSGSPLVHGHKALAGL